MKNKTIFWIALAIIAVVGIIAAGVHQSRQAGKFGSGVTVGAVLVLSGDNALWGTNARKAFDIVVDDVNAHGGINGRSLHVDAEDSAGDPKTALSAFRKLSDIDKVPMVLGDMQSNTTLAMAPLANDGHVVLMGIGSSAPAVTQAGPYVYRVWPSDLYEGSVFAQYVAGRNVKSVAIVYLNNDYGSGLKNAFKDRFISIGGQVPLEEAYNADDKDYKDIAAKVANAHLQAVYIVGYYEDTARMVKTLRESGVSASLFGTSSAINDKFFTVAGESGEGFMAAKVNDFDTDAMTPAQKSFTTAFHTRYGSDPDWAATHAADALLVAVACLKSGAKTGSEIKQHIDQVKTFVGVDRGVQFDDNGDVVNKPLSVQLAKAGKFVTVWKQQ